MDGGQNISDVDCCIIRIGGFVPITILSLRCEYISVSRASHPADEFHLGEITTRCSSQGGAYLAVIVTAQGAKDTIAQFSDDCRDCAGIANYEGKGYIGTGLRNGCNRRIFADRNHRQHIREGHSGSIGICCGVTFAIFHTRTKGVYMGGTGCAAEGFWQIKRAALAHTQSGANLTIIIPRKGTKFVI
ncbi:hypothetical protein SDC9_104065 [bioreactor metagenome]|uniref:Uncharacterized protein n=1 Tax=bioreactor metagenome TaxID=1076179 RepID=A0A645B248_9ZZZZ